MAKNQNSRDLEAQLREVRSRLTGGRIDGAHYDASARLGSLYLALQQVENDELYRHFPVATIAVLETFFRTTVAATINLGTPYLSRGLPLLKDLIRADLLESLHREAMTAGELIAHSLPFNGPSSFYEPLSALLGSDFKQLITTAIDPWDARNEREGVLPVVVDSGRLWRDLALTFEHRHILAHEAALNYEIDRDAAECALISVQTLIAATEAVLWATAWRHLPLTQFEMNVEAWARASEARKDLAGRLRQARSLLASDAERRHELASSHRLWRHYYRSARTLEGSQLDGSMGSMIYAGATERIVRARAEDIGRLIALLDPEARAI